MEDFHEYPEHPLTGRLKLAYKWLPDDIDKLLDAGCSYGYGTRFLKEKSKETYAIELDPVSVEIAKKRYPDVKFFISSVEKTSFDDNFFNAIVFTDVLEHTKDKIQALDEMYRILKPGGIIVLSTPHKGIFTFLDPYNYGYYFRKLLPFIYKPVYKFVRFVKEGNFPKEFNPLHLEKHFHYSLKNLTVMLNKSNFGNNYKIEKVFRSGLFIEVFTMNLEIILEIFFNKSVRDILLRPFVKLSNIDYWIRYRVLSYNIALLIRKK